MYLWLRQFLLRRRGERSGEALLERIHRCLDVALMPSSSAFFVAISFRHGRVIGLHELQKFLFEAAHFGRPESLSSAPLVATKANQHLFFDGERRVLILLQHFRKALPARQLRLASLYPAGRRRTARRPPVRETAPCPDASAGNLTHGLDLRVAANAADGNADVDGGANAGVEKVGLEINLSVGNRNHVRRECTRKRRPPAFQ